MTYAGWIKWVKAKKLYKVDAPDTNPRLNYIPTQNFNGLMSSFEKLLIDDLHYP